MRKLVAILVLVFLSCNAQKVTLAGSRSASFGSASLMTAFRNVPEKVALVHVLFVPHVDAPKGSSGKALSAGGTSESCTLKFEYDDYDAALTIGGEVMVKDNATVHGGGQLFELANGNLFVADISRDRRLQLTQIRKVIRDADASPEAILSAIQSASPRHVRVQTLTASRS